MDTQTFKNKVLEIGFQEYPEIINGQEFFIEDIVKYEETDIELKLYLAQLIICRCFPPSGGIYFVRDCDWFIDSFLCTYKQDKYNPQLTSAIIESIKMIMSDDIFVKGIIGTTFMFGIVEFFAKTKLGFNPNNFDFFDNANLSEFRTMKIEEIFAKLKKNNSKLSEILSYIDSHNETLIKKKGLSVKRWTKVKIGEKLRLYRNTVVHGENHSLYDIGKYLVMLYILFHLDETINENKKNVNR